LRDRTLDLSLPKIMAICNVTPDSFSDGGEHYSVALALEYAERALQEGAALLDIGGESTRPGATPVPAEIELARVLPVIEAVRDRLPELLITVDTVKADVARRALEAGAHGVNDVSAGRLDADMFATVAHAGAGLVLMHSRGSVAEMATYQHAVYGDDPMQEVCDALAAQVEKARDAGIPADAIVLDPGLGFSKTTAHSLTILRELHRFAFLGYPVLVGASRKRFVGEVTGVAIPAQRVLGSAVAHVLAVQRGARIVRTHDVRATREAFAIAAALWPAPVPPE
jgi:dihydropteroate synthase